MSHYSCSALLNPQTTQISLTNGKPSDGTMHVSVAANETVDSTDNSQTHIMIIQEDQGESEDGSSYTTQIISSQVCYCVQSSYHMVINIKCRCQSYQGIHGGQG